MKLYLLTFLTSLLSLVLYGQEKERSTSYANKDTTSLCTQEKIVILKGESEFGTLIATPNDDHIWGVSEEIDGKWTSYYQTSAGRIIGRDSVYIYDNGFDCESEGFIRFRDSKTDLVGMFDKTGKIVVPAIYNHLTNVRNGMISALKGAEQKYWNQENTADDHHFSWTGGEEVLIDTLNNVLIDNFNTDQIINFHTLEKTNAPHSDTTRMSFLATDGTYYSFVEVEKEFRAWIVNELLNDLTVDRLLEISYETLRWETPTGWRKSHKEELIRNNFTILKDGLLEILVPESDYFISSDGLNPYLFEGVEFEHYFNTCGESKDWIYPTLSIILSHGTKTDFTQNFYEFLRTKDGYKLICLTVRNENMKS